MNESNLNAFYYSSLAVRSYDWFNERADKDSVVRGDRDFYVSCAQKFGGPVLELGCGTGRVLLPIAAAGFAITGVDISAAMLNQARRKIALESAAIRERVRFYQMDLASFELDGCFPLALIPFRAFHHLTLPHQQRRALDCINRSLTPRGHLVIDLLDPRLDYCVPGAPPPMLVWTTQGSQQRPYRRSKSHRTDQRSSSAVVH